MSDYPYCVKCERVADDVDENDWCADCVDNYDGPYADGGDYATGAESAGEQWAEQCEIYTGLK